ncbi:ABC transporter substrate-binding protein [Paenibacillus sp. PL91]|uniref:ABC transporter substrate-binding protein n=1 Tax=Paenibacillus sp. PL91 TaxID=2729538 RepID=UPI00145FC185|nr:extracellular solute-binding protein [Paenibacillus sp. PL91]MBC9200300.1 extracellular solute-binding protein [Paenibacillus sp. PL91]
MKALSKFVLPFVILAIILSGCSFGGDNKGTDNNEPSTLKVMYYDEGAFFQEYGMVFSALHPNVEIEVISNQSMYTGDPKDYDAALDKLIEEKQPDILMLTSDQYKKMALDNKLYDLDAVMEKEKYDTEGLIPGMIDYLREEGGGKLYAISPNFYSQVLFYNKDLFEKYQIELPTDRMSWDAVLQLARRFPTDGEPKDRIYGLKMGYNEELFDVASMFATSEGVNFVNAAQKQMTINTDSWKHAIQTALDAFDSKALFFESMNNQESNMAQSYEDYLLRDPFVSGRLAMAIGDSNYVTQIKQASSNEKLKDKVIKNWDLVTVPVGQQNPDQSSMTSFNNLFAIKADSPNKETAWEFLRYVTSEEYARVKTKSNNYGGLPVRTKYITDPEGRNFAAFYNLKPSNNNSYRDFEKLPQSFWGEFRMAAQEELQKVKDDKQTVEEALGILQVKGQEMLLKEDPAVPEEAPSTEVNTTVVE